MGSFPYYKTKGLFVIYIDHLVLLG